MQRRNFVVTLAAGIAAPAVVAAVPAGIAPATRSLAYQHGAMIAAAIRATFGAEPVTGPRLPDLTNGYDSAFEEAIVDGRPLRDVLQALDQDLQRALRTADLGPVNDVLDLNTKGVA